MIRMQARNPALPVAIVVVRHLLRARGDHQRHRVRKYIAIVNGCRLDSRRPRRISDVLDAGRPSYRRTQPPSCEITLPNRGAVVEARGRPPAPPGAIGVPYLGGVDGLRAAGVVGG